MNPRIEKLKEERARLYERDLSIQARLKDMDELIVRLENTDIVGLVRENGLTIDQLAELLTLLETQPNAPLPAEEDDMEEYDEEV